MAGLFRRLRLRKPKGEGDDTEAIEPSPEESSGDPDIYPHRGPDAEGDPDIVGEPQASGTVDAETSIDPAESLSTEGAASQEGGESLATAEAPGTSPTFDPSATEVPLATGPPPRLPEADAAAGGASHRPLAGSTRCFLCGSEMSGSFCPTCRMTWND